MFAFKAFKVPLEMFEILCMLLIDFVKETLLSGRQAQAELLLSTFTRIQFLPDLFTGIFFFVVASSSLGVSFQFTVAWITIRLLLLIFVTKTIRYSKSHLQAVIR